jgi:three-Cys-motif partner protein
MERSKQEEESGDWFDEPRAWSRIKLRILEKYIDAYMRKRGRFHPRFYYVDGFAGAGYYGRPGEYLEEGSPVRLARLAEKISQDNRAFRLICINTERNRNRCNRLRSALGQFPPELIHVMCGTFQEHLNTILQMLGNDPAVCFLDPFGVVGISPHDLLPLLQRHDTELLLNLNTRVLHRLAGSATSDAREAQGKINRLSRILGDKSGDPIPEWLYQRDRLTTQEWEEWAVNRYMNQLKALSPHLRYGLAYPVRERHDGGVKYYLIFASRSKDAFVFMNDFICIEEDDLRLQAEFASRAPGQQSLFGPVHESERETRYRDLLDEIYEYGRSHQGCTRKEIIEEFALRYLGEFMQKHYRHLIDELVNQGHAEFGLGKDKNLRPIRFM